MDADEFAAADAEYLDRMLDEENTEEESKCLICGHFLNRNGYCHNCGFNGFYED